MPNADKIKRFTDDNRAALRNAVRMALQDVGDRFGLTAFVTNPDTGWKADSHYPLTVSFSIKP